MQLPRTLLVIVLITLSPLSVGMVQMRRRLQANMQRNVAKTESFSPRLVRGRKVSNIQLFHGISLGNQMQLE